MKLTFGFDDAKKRCPVMATKERAPYCLRDDCAMWSSRRGECGLKHPEKRIRA